MRNFTFILIFFVFVVNIYSVDIDWEGITLTLDDENHNQGYKKYAWVSLKLYNNGDNIVVDSQGRAHIVWMYNYAEINNLTHKTKSEIRYCRISNSSPPEIEYGPIPIQVCEVADSGETTLNPVIGYGETGMSEYIIFCWEGTPDYNLYTEIEDTDIYIKWLYIDKQTIPPTETWSDVFRITLDDSYQGAPCIDVPENQTGPGPLKVNIAWEDFRHGELINNGEIYYKTVHIQGTNFNSMGLEQRVSNDEKNSLRPNILTDDFGNLHFIYNDMRYDIGDGHGTIKWRPVYRMKSADGSWTDEEIVITHPAWEQQIPKNYNILPNIAYIPPYDGGNMGELAMVSLWRFNSQTGNPNEGFVKKCILDITGPEWLYSENDYASFYNPDNGSLWFFNYVPERAMFYGSLSPYVSFNPVDGNLYFTANTNIPEGNTYGGVCWGVMDFDIGDYLSDSLILEKGEQPVDVTIEFDAHQARYIQEKEWHPTQEIMEREDGSVLLRMTVSSLGEVKRWLLAFGEHAKVITPPELAESVKETIKGMADRYGV